MLITNRQKKFKKISPNYFEYLDFLKTNKEHLKYKNSEYYLEPYPFISKITSLIPSVFYILDYQTQQYLFVSKDCKSLFGYTEEEFMENGQAWAIKSVHPEDIVIFSNDIFTRFLNYSQSLPKDEIKKSMFSVNYRFKKKDGVYIKILQQYVILETNKKGSPLLTLGICTDITPHKTDDKIVFSISKKDEKKGFELVSSTSFLNDRMAISKRENEILRQLFKGLNSKQIGAQLNISLYTVKAHRRNLLEKTKCKNSAQLISYVMANGLI